MPLSWATCCSDCLIETEVSTVLLDVKTGKTLWTGMPRQAENASIVRAGNIVFALEEDADLIVGRVSRTGLQELKRYKVADAVTWSAPAISGNRIFVKDASAVTLWTVGEMQPHVRMLKQEGANGLGLMGREIVRDHVNRAPRRLTGHDVAKEFDKGGAGVARHCLPEHLARLRVQRGEERQRAMPVVLESVSLGAAGRERQHGIEAVQRLDGRLLVDVKDRRVFRRIDVQADHVGGLRLEVGIVRLHVALEPVRLEARALPRFRHEVVMNLEHAPQWLNFQLPTPNSQRSGLWELEVGGWELTSV